MCDSVALGYSLKSENQLADVAGCRFRWRQRDRQWQPETDAGGRAIGAERVYLAGDGADIMGADAAELSGERAALTVLADCGRPVNRERLAGIVRALARLDRFRDGLETAFPFPADLARATADATIVCRCEQVSAGELRRTALALDADEINRAKAFSRLGMGRCQGRVCGPAAAEILAATLQVDVAAVSRLRSQPPIKPVSIAAMQAMAEAAP